jgi:hypothetical protein
MSEPSSPAAEAIRLLSKSDEELLSSSGRDFAKAASPHDFAKRGAEIMENIRTRFASSICADAAIKAAYERVEKDGGVTLLAALIDCLSGSLTGVSPVTVSVLLFRHGVKKLCEQAWNNPASS